MGIIIRQSVKGSIANYIGVMIGYLNLVYLFPLFFSEEQIGIIRFLLEAVVVISGFSMLGTNHAMIRFYPKINQKDNDKGFVFVSFLIPVLGFILFLILGHLFSDSVQNYFKDQAGVLIDYFPFLAPLLFLTMMNIVVETYASMKGRITVPKLIKEVLMRVGLSLAALFFGLKILDFQGVMALIIGVNLILLILNMLYLIRLTRLNFKPDFSVFPKGVITEYFAFTSLILASSFSAVILPRLDFIMVSSMKGMDDTGIYSTAFYLAMVIDIPKRALQQISTPILAKSLHEKDHNMVKRLYERSSLNQTLIGGAIFLAIWINLNYVFNIMPNGEVYRTGIWVCFFIGLGKVIDMSSGLGSAIIANSNFYKYTVLMGIVTTVVAIVGNILLIPILGITGAAVSTCASFGLLTIYTLVIIKKKLGMLPFNRKSLEMLLFLVVFILLFQLFALEQKGLISLIFNNLLFFIPFILLCYHREISPEINDQVRRYLQPFFPK